MSLVRDQPVAQSAPEAARSRILVFTLLGPIGFLDEDLRFPMVPGVMEANIQQSAKDSISCLR